MKDIRQQLEKLTPKQRALYELMLKEKARPRQTLARRQGSGPAPASFPQQRLWVLQQLEPECSFAYNVHITVRFFGPLDVGVLERSFNEVVRRHESLRTTLGSEQGAPVLVVHPEVRVPLPVMELGAWPQARQLAEVERRTREESLRPFELERAPLMRGTVLRLAADDHVVLVTMHHLVTDRWSLGVLVRELMALYEAFSLGRPSPLPELPLQYSDYAAWQREQMKGEHLRKELDYWKRQLTPLPPPLELPTDRPRPARKSYRGSREFVRLPPSLTRALKAVAQQQDCTLFMLLLAAFKSVLHRYCGQADIAVGTPIANRKLPELELLIGFFVNTLVLRTDLSEDPTFRALLQRVRSTCLQAYSHQDLPFERLVEELHPERHLNRNPLFQVMFSFQNTPRQDLAVQGLSTQYLLVDPGSAKFDLLLELREEVEDEITGWLEYDTDLFDGSTLARLHGHLMRVLERVAVTQEDRLSALPLLAEAERHQLLVEWSGPRRDYPLEQTLHARVEAQVERSPHAVAVSFEGHSLTYRELNAQANRLAWHLSALGVGPESRVAVCLERSTHLVVALLATLKAGAAYVPLDPSYPPRRLEWMLEDARPQVLLAQQSLLGRLPAQALPTVLLDTPWDSGRRLSEDNPPPLASPDNLAYVLFTSGSTGRPKGAMNTHRAISNRLLWMQEAYGLGPREAVLQKTPFSFDVSVWEFFWPLLVGARLVVARPGGHQDPAYLASLIHEQHVTTLHFVPPMLQAFLQEPELERACASVRRIICSGEALPAELARRCLQRLPQAELHNLYGPTEAAVDVTAWACRREDERPSVPIGRPIANTYVRLMDGQGGLVPVGVPGELYIGGVQVGRGYLGRPELTAERFVSDPYSPRPQERLYRTGDLARWLPDGSIDFLGRVDFQVKVRGLRIELGEVESALLQAPGVREGVVVAREELAGDKRLVGYVVPQPGQSLDTAAVRALLQQRLPEYMVPSVLVVLPALPLSPNGKVDRKALPAPDESHLARRQYVPPRTEEERTLAALWAEVLGIDRVGVEDNFFELGGHSLLATQVAARIRATLGIELPLRALFESPTLASLARRLEAAGREGQGVAAAPPFTHAPRTEPLPLSFAQQRLWILEELHPGSSAYNMLLAFELEGELDTEVLRRCFEEVLRRHESLRTAFQGTSEAPLQVISPPGRFELPVVDLSPLTTPQAEALKLAAEEAGQPFQLSRGPLLRARLLRTGPRVHLLAVAMHHIVSDGWSLGVLSREITDLYRAFSSGQPSPLPALPLQYADFAVWQRAWLRGELLARQLGYWRQQLAAPLPTLELPTDRPRPALQTFRGAQHVFVLPSALVQGLEALGRQQGATLFMTLLSGFKVLLHRYSGQEDLVVGSPIAGRTRPELEGLIGLFVNTLALRTRVQGAFTFLELLRLVREATLQAYAHQDLPFEQLVEELQPRRDLSRSPLFQVMFVLQNMPLGVLELPGLVLSPRLVDSGTSKFDLTLYLQHSPEGLQGVLEYNTDLFDPATVERMMGHYRALLEAVLSDPLQRVSELPLLAEAERRQLLVEWNDTAVDFPGGALIHTLFQAQVARTPQAVAVVCGDSQLTYRELAERAHQLAWHLRSLGVSTDSRVGLCVERSVDMVVGMLGVLEAGGAYVPLDPAYPPERLAYMLEDSGARVLVTQGHLLDRLSCAGMEVVLLEDRTWTHERRGAPPEGALPDSAAYVIYTSGSTGWPKGVLVPHRTVINFFTAMDRTLEFPERPVWLAATSISFDISVLELLWTLTRGFKVVVQVDARERGWLAEQVRRHAVTHLQFTPSLARGLLLEPEAAWAPGSLRQVLVGGEALPAELACSLLERLEQGALLNMYGPTETTVWSTLHPVRQPGLGTVSIGRALANTRLYVLDARLQPVPVGVPGELYIGGAGVTRGYLGRAELTAERFIPDAFSPEPGARMYRTGDVVRWRAEGNLEFLGRADNQVKVRGFRIELGEVEAGLLQASGVREAAVVVREDEAGDRRLVGYVVPQPGHPLDTAAVRALLQQRLPEYMVPSALVVLSALPLSPNGKLDRKALPAPQRASERKASRPPEGPVEQALARIWSEVLRVEAVGAEDDFFALGGHSLLGLRVVSLARREGLALEVHQLFQHSTLAALAAAVGSSASPRQPLAQAATSPAPEGEEALPCTPQQRWYLETFDIENHVWAQSLVWDTPPGFDPELLRQSVAFLFEHHDVFRLRFYRSGGGWAQRMLPTAGEPHVEVLDLGALEPEAQRKAVLEVGSRLQGSLSIVRGPVLAFALCRTGGKGPDKLLIAIHHAVYDAYALGIFFEDLAGTYRQLAAGQQPRPLSVPTRYREYLLAAAAYGNSQAMEQARAFWLEEARLRPVAPLPVDMPGGRHTDLTSRRYTLLLPPGLMGCITSYLRSHEDVSLNDLLLHALAQAYARWSGSRTLRLDLEHNGRSGMLPGLDLSRMVGPATIKVPLLLELPAGEPPAEALVRLKRSVRQVLAHALGYGLLRYGPDAVVRQRLAAAGSPQLFFNNRGITLLGRSSSNQSHGQIEGLIFPRADGEESVVSYDLMVECDDTEQGPMLTLVYGSTQYREQTVHALASDMLSHLLALTGEH